MADEMNTAALRQDNRETQPPVKRRTFVLIHGAWHGGWVWRKVVDRLETAGCHVMAPTLTGLADRSHLLSDKIDLNTHIADIVNLFEWYDLHNVTIVAHSYAGWPVSGAIEQIAPRVDSLVFLDAFVPENGEKGTDQQTPDVAAAFRAAVARGDIARPVPPPSFFNLADPNDAEWASSKLTPHPIGVALQPIELTGVRDRIKHKQYIRANRYSSSVFDKYFSDAQQNRDWTATRVDSGHMVMLDAPDLLVGLLLNSG